MLAASNYHRVDIITNHDITAQMKLIYRTTSFAINRLSRSCMPSATRSKKNPECAEESLRSCLTELTALWSRLVFSLLVDWSWLAASCFSLPLASCILTTMNMEGHKNAHLTVDDLMTPAFGASAALALSEGGESDYPYLESSDWPSLAGRGYPHSRRRCHARALRSTMKYTS